MSILDTFKSWFGGNKTEVIINEAPVVTTPEPEVQAPVVEAPVVTTPEPEVSVVEEVMPEAAPKTDDTIMGDNQ